MPYFPFRCGSTASQRSGPTVHLTAGSASHSESELEPPHLAALPEGCLLSASHHRPHASGITQPRASESESLALHHNRVVLGNESESVGCQSPYAQLLRLTLFHFRTTRPSKSRCTRAPLREETDAVFLYSEQQAKTRRRGPTPTLMRCERGSEARESEVNAVYPLASWLSCRSTHGCGSGAPAPWFSTCMSAILPGSGCSSSLLDVGRSHVLAHGDALFPSRNAKGFDSAVGR